ncbi:hypothetical protein COU37_03140 [Candidatus Micrarchaeota archaeon CG10_big_fil_rev_8_21_14_0_10_45_29]|nr:MAG: hypothetical protein COU37_03140 [Candidatus Micrarchaeota archaeon CG10_big_fil_rev_8_21_14_0_10_45_29]QBM01573.1 hypothetical protein [uncultured archaeon]
MKAQSSIEFIISVSILLIILAAMITLSFEMQESQDIISSRLEGRFTAGRVATAMDWAAIAGDGAIISIAPLSYPQQNLIISGAQAISFGPQNTTIRIASSIADAGASTGFISSNQRINVSYYENNILITTG